MASTKTFADMKKPARRPTPEQIAAFEETGRVVPAVNTETRKPANTEKREGGNTEARESADTEIRLPSKAQSQEHGNPETRKAADAGSQKSVHPEPRKSVNTETRVSAPIVRLTIDLPETVHTRFKAACAMTKRKMVDEVRDFIEQRTAELEGEAGRVL